MPSDHAYHRRMRKEAEAKKIHEQIGFLHSLYTAAEECDRAQSKITRTIIIIMAFIALLLALFLLF